MKELPRTDFDEAGVCDMLAEALKICPSDVQRIGGQNISRLTASLNVIAKHFRSWNDPRWESRFQEEPDEDNQLQSAHRAAKAIHENVSTLVRQLTDLRGDYAITIGCYNITAKSQGDAEAAAKAYELKESAAKIDQLVVALREFRDADLAYAHDPSLKRPPFKDTAIRPEITKAFQSAVSKEHGYSDKAAGRFVASAVKEITGRTVDAKATRRGVQRMKEPTGRKTARG